jgi:hypothetical protein
VPSLHGVDDRLQCLGIVGVAGEDLVAQGKAIEGHHQRNQDLLAVGTVITRIAALRLPVGLRQTLEIGAGDIVEEHFVVDRKQLAATLRQMRFEGGLVDEQAIKPTIKAIFVDVFLAELKEIAQRRSAIPVLGDVQLTRWLAEPCRHKHRRHLRPGNTLLARWHHLLAKFLKTEASP